MKDTKFAAYVGIDWADAKHAVCLVPADSQQHEESELTQSAEAIDEWATHTRKRFGGRQVGVCVEQSRGALIYALMKYDFLVLFPINPKQLACYREALKPSNPKNDPTDAHLIVDFLRLHGTSLRPWLPDDAATRSIRLLAEGRRKLVDDRTRLGNRLREQLKQCYPLALELLESQAMFTVWFLRLLSKYASHKALRRASARSLLSILPSRKSDEPVDPRITLIRKAKFLVTDEALLMAGELEVKSLVGLMRGLNKAIAEYDRNLAERLAAHPDASIFTVLPGAGPVMAPRLLAAFGSDRSRFASAEDVQRQSGIAPVMQQSGTKKIIRRRRACPKFLRQTFHEFAHQSRKGSAWARAYYQMLRAKKMGHHAALRALAFKWIRVLFRCWKDRIEYQERKYIDQLRAKNSPIIAYLKPLLNTPT